MANAYENTGTYGTYYYIDSSSSRDVLTKKQMQVNVTYIYSCIHDKYPSWTLNAIAAMCGNFQSEGALNPAQWEYGRGKSTSYGYGLAQWTPATKLLDWLTTEGYSRLEIDPQIIRIDYERENGLQYYKTLTYDLSFSEFLTSLDTPSYLAGAWLYNYERPKYPLSTINKRQLQANEWYTYLTGETPTEPDPSPPTPPTPEKPGAPELSKSFHMPIWMYPEIRR